MERGRKGSIMYTPSRVALLLLQLLLVTRQATALPPSHMIETCAGLKQAIETAAAAARDGADADGPVLTLRLSGEAPYLCEDRILVGEAQRVEVVGAGDSPSSNVLVVFQPKNNAGALPPPTSRRSLFVNEGSLRLSNISFRLDAGGSEAEAEGEEGAYCAGAGLVRNSGRVMLEGVQVLESRGGGGGDGALSSFRCRGGEAGRIVSGRRTIILAVFPSE